MTQRYHYQSVLKIAFAGKTFFMIKGYSAYLKRFYREKLGGFMCDVLELLISSSRSVFVQLIQRFKFSTVSVGLALRFQTLHKNIPVHNLHPFFDNFHLSDLRCFTPRFRHLTENRFVCVNKLAGIYCNNLQCAIYISSFAKFPSWFLCKAYAQEWPIIIIDRPYTCVKVNSNKTNDSCYVVVLGRAMCYLKVTQCHFKN